MIKPIVHLAVFEDGTIQDVSSLSIVDVLGSKAAVNKHGDTDVLIYPISTNGSPILPVMASLGYGTRYYEVVSGYRSQDDTTPWSLQRITGINGVQGTRTLYKKASPMWSYSVEEAVTQEGMEAWIACCYVRGSTFIESSDITHMSSPASVASRTRWYPKWYSPIKGLAEIASKTVAIVIGDESLLKNCGLSFKDGSLDICGILPIRESFKKFIGTTNMQSNPVYCKMGGGRNVGDVADTPYVDWEPREIGQKIAKALEPSRSLSLDIPYYAVDTVEECLETAYMVTNVVHLTKKLLDPAVPPGVRKYSSEEVARLLVLAARSYDPRLDSRWFTGVPPQNVDNACLSTDWSGLLSKSVFKGQFEDAVVKHLKLFKSLRRSVKASEGILYRSEGHLKADERIFKREYSAFEDVITTLSGFSELYYDWVEGIYSLFGNTITYNKSMLAKTRYIMSKSDTEFITVITSEGGVDTLVSTDNLSWRSLCRVVNYAELKQDYTLLVRLYILILQKYYLEAFESTQVSDNSYLYEHILQYRTTCTTEKSSVPTVLEETGRELVPINPKNIISPYTWVTDLEERGRSAGRNLTHLKYPFVGSRLQEIQDHIKPPLRELAKKLVGLASSGDIHKNISSRFSSEPRLILARRALKGQY
jgi:hypothetical protein